MKGSNMGLDLILGGEKILVMLFQNPYKAFTCALYKVICVIIIIIILIN